MCFCFSLLWILDTTLNLLGLRNVCGKQMPLWMLSTVWLSLRSEQIFSRLLMKRGNMPVYLAETKSFILPLVPYIICCTPPVCNAHIMYWSLFVFLCIYCKCKHCILEFMWRNCLNQGLCFPWILPCFVLSLFIQDLSLLSLRHDLFTLTLTNTR